MIQPEKLCAPRDLLGGGQQAFWVAVGTFPSVVSPQPRPAGLVAGLSSRALVCLYLAF